MAEEAYSTSSDPTTPDSGKPSPCVALKQLITDDYNALDKWYARDEELAKRRMGARPQKRVRPYPGAPNFVEPIIDDTVREKTDQEVSMAWNAPHLAHACPLAQVDPSTKAAMQVGFDSYLRYIVQIRARMEQCMDTKNSRGFAVGIQVREYNEFLENSIPTMEVCDIRDIIVPPHTRVHAGRPITDRICRIRRFSESEFKQEASRRGWSNVEATLDRHASLNRDDKDPKDTQSVTQELVGVTSSRGCKYILVHEVYHLASKEDAEYVNPAWRVVEGDRMVSVYCPDAPEIPLLQFPWRETDEVKVTPASETQPESSVIVKGKQRPWPFVQFRYEERSDFWYDTRGGGHLCLDEQIAATQIRNMEAVQIEYTQKPLFKQTDDYNSGNVSFVPGSILPKGIEPMPDRQVNPQLSFAINNCKATAARRMGAGGLYNFSTEVSSRRKVEKTKAEIDVESSRTSSMSSSSVDRFNEPWATMINLIWQDLKRMQLQFPVIIPGTQATIFPPEAYAAPVLFMPAASAKTLDPNVQLERSSQMVGWLHSLADVLPNVDFEAAVKSTLYQFDPRQTDGWITPSGGNTPLGSMLKQIAADIQALAQGGKDLQARIKNIESSIIAEEKAKQMVEGMPA